MTVDELIAAGGYRDRRNQRWHRLDDGMWCNFMPGGILRPKLKWIITEKQMRLKIIRERHRLECRGLFDCTRHPVPNVHVGDAGGWHVGPADSWACYDFAAWDEALAQARQFAVAW